MQQYVFGREQIVVFNNFSCYPPFLFDFVRSGMRAANAFAPSGRNFDANPQSLAHSGHSALPAALRDESASFNAKTCDLGSNPGEGGAMGVQPTLLLTHRQWTSCLPRALRMNAHENRMALLPC